MMVWAVIAAAGAGARMGAEMNKTLLPLGGVPAISYSVRTLKAVCDGVVLAVREEEQPLFEAALREQGLSVDLYAPGGDTRQDTVQNALAHLPEACGIVLVHDGARPLASQALIRRVIGSARTLGSGVPALPLFDTIKHLAPDGRSGGTAPRDSLRAVQTPQGFQKRLLLQAYATGRHSEATDEAALCEKAGIPVYFVEGERRNIKLTVPEDRALAELYVRGLGEVRCGFGYDAHRLVEGRSLVLCGVTVPHEKGLLGHSDADAGLHALIDALLGAAALGDIGAHFPDSDERWRGACSADLLRRTVAILAEAGFSPRGCDITLVLQRPRLAPYMGAMRGHVAGALGLCESHISIKAKTTEGMGFEGAGEGVSAYASATVIQRMP